MKKGSAVECETEHMKGRHRRETCMGVCYLLRQEQAVARDRASGVIVRLREHAGGAKAGERRHGEGYFGGLEVLAREDAAVETEKESGK